MNSFIEQREAADQQWLLQSGLLPVRILTSTEEEFLLLGFEFGRIDPSEPIFREAVLPGGWTLKPSAYSRYWSIIHDHLDRPRVCVFYKKTLYDHRAEMDLIPVSDYVSRMVTNKQPVITDDVWATPRAVAVAACSWLDRMSAYLSTAEGMKDTAVHEEVVRFHQLVDTYKGAL